MQVLCVLLLQNAGLKSKDIAARTMAIDLLGTIAARLKRDSVLCKRDNFWVIQELVNGDCVDHTYPKGACSICLDGRVEKLFFICQSCQRLFHADCMGVREQEVPNRSWQCQICICRKQLLVLQSYCKSQCKDDGKKNHNWSEKNPEASDPITKLEIVQQLLLNYLQDVGSSDDVHLFVRWFVHILSFSLLRFWLHPCKCSDVYMCMCRFYLCLWYKDDPKSQQKFIFYLARLKSKAIIRDSGIASSFLTRDSVKKITLALGQNNSFSRGFDKILHMLLVSQIFQFLADFSSS